MADLLSIKEGLKKEKGNEHHIQRLDQAIERGTHAFRTAPAPEGVEARLERIEAMLEAAQPHAARIGGKGKSWADVAITGARQAGVPQALYPARHTVRVQLAQAKGLANEEILKEVKKTITGATAIRVLHSGDIDVTLPDEATKDRAQGLPPTEGLKIFKRDYLVEIPGVPLSVRVACEKGADNSHLATAICEASRAMAPGLQISRIRWLHDQRKRSQPADATPAKTRGSLIVGFHTQEMQRRAIRGGLVIDAQLFEVRPFEKDLLAVRCYKCQAWGHTQSVCRKPARCGQCAGAHESRECPEERTSCANCGKQHRAWQQRDCPASQAYFRGIQSRRIELYAHAASIRGAAGLQEGPSAPQAQNPLTHGGTWTTISRKRQREASQGHDDARRIGRPTNIEQAAKNPTQKRISFSQPACGTQDSSTDTASQDTPIDPNEY